MAIEPIAPVALSPARAGEAKLNALIKEKFRSNGWPTGVVFEPVTSDAQAAARVQEIRNNAAAFKAQGIKVTAGPWIRDLDNGSFKLSIRYEMDLTRPANGKRVNASVDEAVRALGAKISQSGGTRGESWAGSGQRADAEHSSRFLTQYVAPALKARQGITVTKVESIQSDDRYSTKVSWSR